MFIIFCIIASIFFPGIAAHLLGLFITGYLFKLIID